jgi:hypothetical protein
MCAVHGFGSTCRCGYALAAVLAFAIAGCASLRQEAVSPDPCAAEIVRLEGLRDVEVAAACAGQEFDACLSVAVIDHKYDPLIQAQVRCEQ